MAKTGTFEYRNHKYQFTCQQEIRVHVEGKEIWVVSFTTAPEGGPFYTGQPYCLKRIRTKVSNSPGSRDYWELVDFQGEHLRQLIAVDDSAAQQVRLILDTGAPQNGVWCQSLEALQENLEQAAGRGDGAFLPRERTVAWRLSMLQQCVQGLQELYRQVLPHGRRITALRDLKLANVLVDGDHARLIDFATIRITGGNMPAQDPGTFRNPVFSLQNTAPEEVLGTAPATAKTDCFALGMMLAELFANQNPLRSWLWPAWQDEATTRDTVLALYNEAVRMEQAQTAKGSGIQKTWLERMLDGRSSRFCWDENLQPEILKEIRSLFLRMIHMDPAQRPELDCVYEEMERIKALAANLPEGGFLPAEAVASAAAQQPSKPRRNWFAALLVNTDGLTQDLLVAYRAAANRIWRMEAQYLEGPFQLQLIPFHSADAPHHCLLPDFDGLIPDRTALDHAIRALPMGESPQDGQCNGLAAALIATGSLCHAEARSFSGGLYILSPTEPHVVPVRSHDGTYLDTEALLQRCETELECRVRLFTAEPPTAEPWYSWQSLVEGNHPEHEKPRPNGRLTQPQRANNLHPSSPYAAGVNAPYVLVNGKKQYIGRRKED